VLEEPAEKLHAVELGGTEAGTADFPVGKGDRAVREADETVVGDGDLEDLGGQVGEGGVTVGLRLTVDVPGDGPDLGSDVLQQSGLVHGFLEECPVDGRERCDRDKEVGSGRQPCCAVLCESAAGHNIMDMRVVLELPAPRMQDPGEPREVRADETRVVGEPFEGCSRGGEHGVIGETLMRADEGTQGLRNGEGHKEVRSGQLLVQVMCEPLLGCMLLTLRTVAVPTGMVDAVLPSTAWALRETVPVVSAAAVLDGADDLAVRGGEVGRALQVCWRKGGEDSAQGDHGSRPCMRALRRA
jgi:hypothetical protein